MKATIVLLAGNDAQNYGTKIMYQAHKAGNLGFEMARLPQHVSLKQPFTIKNLQQFEEFFDSFAKTVKPVKIQLEELQVFPCNVLAGLSSGCLSISVRKSDELVTIQRHLFKKLEDTFGNCLADHDSDYVFHMTVAIGGAEFANYQTAYQKLCELDFKKEFIFDKLGLLYYDDDSIKPGTYFCYKIVAI